MWRDGTAIRSGRSRSAKRTGGTDVSRTSPRSHYGTKRRLRADGYVDLWLPAHPLARKDGYVFEHRIVLADAGLDIPPDHQVHHRNGIRNDNRLENLEVLRADEHTRRHAPERRSNRCPHGHEFTPENTAFNPSGWRYCKQCNRDRARRARRRVRAQVRA